MSDAGLGQGWRGRSADRIARHLVNRDFARLWFGQAVSTVGDFVFDTTLTIWVATQLFSKSHWGPAAISGLMLCAFVAIIVVGPAAGVFVDRWNRRRTMLGTEVIRGALVGVLLLVTLLPIDALPVGVWLVLLYVVVFLVNATGQFFTPARFATVGDIVTDDADRTKAFGLGQATAATAAVIGPPLAAPLLLTLGIQWALLINALSYVVSFFAIRSINFPARDIAATTETDEATKPAKPKWRAEFADGMRVFAGNRFLVALLFVFVISSLGTGALTPLLLFFVSDNLHSSPTLLGVMTMAYGLGAILGALMAGRFARLLGSRKVTWLGLVLGGCLLAVYARQTSFVPAMILLFLDAIPVAVMNASLGPQLLAAAPKAYLGRIVAVISPINMAASTASLIAAGWLASTALRTFHGRFAGVHVSRIDTIFTVSAILVALAGIIAALTLPPVGAQPAPPPAAEVGTDTVNPLEPVGEVALENVAMVEGEPSVGATPR